MNAENTVYWLLDQDPCFALQWCYEGKEGIHPFPDNFDWRGLAECAASNAFSRLGGSSLPHLEWAEIAVFSYNFVIQEEKVSTRLAHDPEKKKMSYFSLELAVMRIRANCISLKGHVAGDPVLDVAHLVEDFLDPIILIPHEVEKKWAEQSERYKHYDHEERIHSVFSRNERWELLRIRIKLRILEPLEKRHLLPFHPVLSSWFALHEQIGF